MERGGKGDKKKEEFLGKSREGDRKKKEAKEDKRKRKDGGRRSKKINSELRMIFWNVAGLKKKDRDF